jgi:hypothetical protein
MHKLQRKEMTIVMQAKKETGSDKCVSSSTDDTSSTVMVLMMITIGFDGNDQNSC